MHILMISDVFFPRVNGVSTSIATFRQELIQLGHRVSLFVPEYIEQQYPDDHDVIRVKSRGVMFDPEDRMMHYTPLIEAIKDHANTCDQAYDIVHIQTPFIAHYAGIKVAKELGLPTIESYHTFFEEYLYHYLPFVPKKMMRYLARHFSRSQCNSVDHLVVPSSPMLEVLRQYQIDSDATVIPTGINTDQFGKGDGEAFRVKYGIPLDRPMLVHISRVAHEKNIDFIFHMHQKLVQTKPDALLLIAGDGPAKPHLQKLSEKLGIIDNVMFLGYLDRHTELASCYQAGDVFVFASRTETQGLVLLEAMAMGTPVVSTAVMGTKDILNPQKGALIAEENVDDFSTKVQHLLDDQPTWIRLQKEGREYINQWSPKVMAEKLVSAYQHTCDSHSVASKETATENA